MNRQIWKQIAELERRIGRSTPETPEQVALRAEADELRKQLHAEEDGAMNLTDMEKQGLRGISKSDFQDTRDPELMVEKAVWSWSANTFMSPRSFSGVVASLVKKGLVKTAGEGEDACVALTRAGVDALKQL